MTPWSPRSVGHIGRCDGQVFTCFWPWVNSFGHIDRYIQLLSTKSVLGLFSEPVPELGKLVLIWHQRSSGLELRTAHVKNDIIVYCSGSS